MRLFCYREYNKDSMYIIALFDFDYMCAEFLLNPEVFFLYRNTLNGL